MPAMKVRHYNAAGRLHAFFQTCGNLNAGSLTIAIKDLAAILSVEPSPESLYAGIAGLFDQLAEAREAIIQSNFKPAKQDLHLNILEDVGKSLSSVTINLVSGQCTLSVNKDAIGKLEFLATDLHDETPVEEEDLARLIELCDELRDEIFTDRDMNKNLAEFLLGLIRIMVQGIERYKVRGARGLRKALDEMLGKIVTNQDLVQEANAERPGVWKKIAASLSRFTKVVENVQALGNAVQTIMKAIEHTR